jgi:MinD-like ATPase involved in chromosome partitioning or flagellar assembly
MITTFYSYKGGVGRTQLLVNLASYYCYKEGKKILLIDWDLEAPGIHHYFNLNNVSTNGLIELFYSYVDKIKEGNNVNKNNLEFNFNELILQNISNCDSKTLGRIDFIPSANYSKGLKYISKLINSFNWKEFYDLLDGANYLEIFKEKLKSLDYDYIFIDSRTGLTDYLGICNVQLADLNVILVAPTNQNFSGALEVSSGIKNSPYITNKNRLPLIIPILSRLDLSIEEKSNQWIAKFNSDFKEYIAYIKNYSELTKANTPVKNYCIDTLLDYKRDLAFGEEILFNSKKSSIGFGTLAEKYKNIGLLLNSIKEKSFKKSIKNEIIRHIDPSEIFTPSTPLFKSEFLVGRNELMDSCKNSFATPNSPVLILGERGSGKTSFLNYFINILKDHSTKLKVFNRLKFVHSIFLQCDKSLHSIEDLILELIKPSHTPNSLSQLYPEVYKEYYKEKIITNYNINLGPINLSFHSPETPQYKRTRHIVFKLFEEILHKIESKYPDSSPVFFIDDFDLIQDKTNIDLLIKSSYNTKFVFTATSSSSEDLFPNQMSVHRKLLGNVLKVNTLKSSDIRDYFEIIERKYNFEITFSHEYIDRVIKYSSGYPYLLHFLSYNSFKIAQNQRKTGNIHVQHTHLLRALEEILETYNYNEYNTLSEIFNSESKTTKKILKVLASLNENRIIKSNLRSLMSGNVLRYLDSSIQNLLDLNILIEERNKIGFNNPILKLIIKVYFSDIPIDDKNCLK